MKDDRERLLHILDATDRIAKYVVEGRERFDRDELVQTWIIHHIQINGSVTSPRNVRMFGAMRLWNLYGTALLFPLNVACLLY